MKTPTIIGTQPGVLHGINDVTLDVDVLLATRLLIQANSGGGKSYLLRRLCEQLYGKVQVIVIDPEGEFATLREKYGYVLVGKGGDTPADVRSADLLARRLLELNASAVCDIYELQVHTRHEWVKKFLTALVNAPKSLWHPCIVIVDESHLFAPEKGQGESVALNAMLDLATRGRKRGLCAVWATQRLGKLSKNGAAELQNVMIGSTFLDIDRKRAAETLGVQKKDEHKFFEALKEMQPGNFYAQGRAISRDRVLVNVGAIETSHPQVGKHTAVPPVVPENVRALLPQLEDLPHEAETKEVTEKELRQQVATLTAQLSRAVERKPVADTDAIAKAVDNACAVRDRLYAAHTVQVTKAFNELKEATVSRLTAAQAAELPQLVSADKLWPCNAHGLTGCEECRDKLLACSTSTINRIASGATVNYSDAFNTDMAKRCNVRDTTVNVRLHTRQDNPKIPKGEKQILTACAQYPDGLTREQLTIFTGQKRSTRDAYIQRVSQRGYVAVNGAVIVATDEGIAALGDDYTPLPTGEALREYWLQRLPEGERTLLHCLVGDYPHTIQRDELTTATGYKRSTRDAYLQRLGSKRLVEFVGRGEVKASAQLFN